MELTRHLWQGERAEGGHRRYDERIPIVVVGLNQLREHGPAGPVFARFGRSGPQTRLEAVGNPCLEAARARAEEEYRAREEKYQEQVRRAAEEQAAMQAAEREAGRPVCTGCGARFTDERWEAAHATGWGRPKDTHLCFPDDPVISRDGGAFQGRAASCAKQRFPSFVCTCPAFSVKAPVASR
ncbi:hypothetical protein ACHGLA_00600 [Streptomyces sp. YH02]|uniref:hypothetical protein n=1 Tax=Streptomyces sp. YH02 TaxID=3256999 RepID=UPI00375806FA